MNLIHAKGYQELSEIVALIMVEAIEKNPRSNLCLATGSSPSLAYDLFVDHVCARNTDVSGLRFTKLDEWCGIPMDHPSTCEAFIRTKLLDPLKIPEDRYLSFDSMTTLYDEEGRRIHEALTKHPIDLCILGLGKNGHLGLNEPSSILIPFAHVANLAEKTKTHPMIEGVVVNKGFTLGMQEILNSKRILLIVSGDGKHEIYRKFLNQEVDTELPASFLWLHDDVTVVVQDDRFN
ncbi:MAG TPA: galactosamine-6-phosphate isomerase [Erysipelotrichaceae bacterium]|nr:galactosamine-6-phosphate isomerase [Erysipelotrichaceae bacterium]